jgi:multicomponent Na+:H+ antiporter subunit D
MFSIIGAHIVSELGVGMPLAYIICFTIIISSIIALTQDNLKRRLAYSTIGQMGYIILGIALLTPYGLWGGMIHVANHAFMKGTLFLCAGTIIKRLGLRNISEMRGIANKLPWTMGAFTVAALGMIGLPPTAGFISKWYLCLGSLEAEKLIFVIVLLLSSLLGAAYFLPIVYTAFFQEPLEEMMVTEGAKERHAVEAPAERGKREAPWSLLAPVLAGALGVIILGICAEVHGLPLSAARFATQWFLR